MVIHNLQAEFRLLIAIVHTRVSKNIVICAEIARLNREIFMRVCVRTIRWFFHYVNTLYKVKQNVLKVF